MGPLRAILAIALLAVVLLAGAAGCASEGFPPGGPEDRQPPVLVESEPADRAINAVGDQAIRLRFDEILDDRQIRELPRLIRVNPDEPTFEYILDDDTVILEPQAPMLDGVTYAVTLMPGIMDRGGNATTQARSVLFAVGGTTPITLSLVRATIVRDTAAVPLAYYRLDNQETDFGYTMVADSQGRVTVEGVAYGPYVATAWLERVRPEGWQEDEEPGARDTFELGAGNRGHEAVYRLAVRDTSPPLVRRVEMISSITLSVVFDDTLGTDPPPANQVRVWESVSGVSGREVSLDSLALADVRGRRLAVAEVHRVGQTSLQIDMVLPLENGEVYRVEVPGLTNHAGTRVPEGEGSTFRAEFPGARVFRAEPLAIPEADAGAPP